MANIDLEKLNTLIEQGMITSRAHPSGQLTIYNYTTKTQYKNCWTEESMQCRGLICDNNGNIIARPFKKFFNLDEHKGPLPDEYFDVYEKLDGSLGILYFFQEVPYISSRGSFDSKQALIASTMLHGQYKNSIPLLDKTKTYLFELIHPENKFVVDYGEEKSLNLLAIIDTETGQEYNFQEHIGLGFPLVKNFNAKDIKELKQLNLTNKEGFVIKFKNGLRLKLKFANYTEMHAVVSKITNVTVWEMLREKKSFEEMISNLPDELFAWIEELTNGFLSEFKTIENNSRADFIKIMSSLNNQDRRKLAIQAKNSEYTKIIFAMVDNKNYEEIIWQMLKPEKELPFRLRKQIKK